jgi:hypothetical protein
LVPLLGQQETLAVPPAAVVLLEWGLAVVLLRLVLVQQPLAVVLV